MKGANANNRKHGGVRVKTAKEVRSDFERLQRTGVEFFIDGEVVHVGDAVRCTVQEPCSYMADYVLGQNGSVKQVRLDRVD